MGAGSNGGSEGPFRTKAYPKGGHKRAMSHQYVNSHNTTAPDYNSLTAGGSLGIDFPPSYYNNSSSASNLRNLVVVPSDNGFSGTQLTSRSNGAVHNTINMANSTVVTTSDEVPIEDIVREQIEENKNDALSLCSLPPYSEMKVMLQESIEGVSSDSADQKLKIGTLNSKAIRNELKKTFMAFIFQQIAQLIMIWTVVKSNDRMDLESPVLPDVILSRVPMVKKAGQWSEILLFTLFLIFTINVLFHKHRFLVLRRVLAVTGICLIIRSFCVWATVLPRSLSSMECAPKSRNSSEVIHRVFIMYITSGLSIFGGHMCGNYFFSGHTCLMTIVHAAFYQYTPDVFSPMKRVVSLLCVTIAILILLAHNHYTLDIIGAYYVASRVWMFYHFLAHNPQYRLSSQLNFSWSWLVNIFEDGSESQVKNEFQSLREIYHMICQQTEAHNNHHHRSKSRNSQKLQTV